MHHAPPQLYIPYALLYKGWKQSKLNMKRSNKQLFHNS